MIRRAFDANLGYCHIEYYLHKKWIPGECSGRLIWWAVSVNDSLEPMADPDASNECVKFSAARFRQWNIPLSAVGVFEKWEVAPLEKKIWEIIRQTYYEINNEINQACSKEIIHSSTS